MPPSAAFGSCLKVLLELQLAVALNVKSATLTRIPCSSRYSFSTYPPPCLLLSVLASSLSIYYAVNGISYVSYHLMSSSILENFATNWHENVSSAANTMCVCGCVPGVCVCVCIGMPGLSMLNKCCHSWHKICSSIFPMCGLHFLLHAALSCTNVLATHTRTFLPHTHITVLHTFVFVMAQMLRNMQIK